MVEADLEDAAVRERAAERIKEVGAMKGRYYIGASRHMRWASCSWPGSGTNQTQVGMSRTASEARLSADVQMSR